MLKSLSVTSPNQLASNAKPAGERTDKSDHMPDDDAMRSAFRGAALGMSWQLAVIVLISIVGGHKLDTMNHSEPYLTLLGLVVALAGSIIVIRKALVKMNNFEVPQHDK